MTRDSKLKEKILYAAHEALFFGRTDFIGTYHTIMEGFYWEDIKEGLLQNIRRYVSCLMNEEERNHLERLLHPFPLLIER